MFDPHLAVRALCAAALSAALAACSSNPSPAREPHVPTAPATTAEAVAAAPAPAAEPVATREAVPAVPAALTCETAVKSVAAGACGILEKAPRADVSGAAVKSVVAVWKKLESPFHAMTGRETALVVLAPEARVGDGPDAKPIPPAAYICPGAPPTVYVPHTLVQLIDDKDPAKYPSDFLAFVVGHELGHRMNDITADGCQLAAFQRPGKGVQEEELADARSAFFITSAGFSASRVAKEDMVSRFLEAEYALGRTESVGRRDSLLGALRKFDSYEALYQASLSIAMSGEMEAADRLLSWADELVQSHGVPLPELRVVRALTRIDRAAEMAPWRGELGLPVGIENVRCTPLHPGHSGLYEEPDRRVRGPDLERGRKLLREALDLLAEAEARGATPFTVAAARTCAHLYLGDAAAAAQEQARAESLLPKSAPAVVKDALADNRVLVTFLGFVRKKPVPEDERALRTWTDQLAAALGKRVPPSMAEVLAALRDPDAPPPSAAAGPTCPEAKPARVAAFAALPATSTHGQCPAGYTLAHALPSLDAAAQTGSKQGITVCRADAGDGELVAVRLIATTEPPLEALDRTMRSWPVPAALRALSAWSCQCASVDRKGVSDRGEAVYAVRCPAIGLDRGVIVATGGRVEAVIAHSR